MCYPTCLRCSEHTNSCSIDGVSYGGVICMLSVCQYHMRVAKSAWMSNQQCITERMESHAQSSCLPFIYYHGVRCQCQVRMSVHSNRNYEHNNQNGFTRYTAFNETEKSCFRRNDERSARRAGGHQPTAERSRCGVVIQYGRGIAADCRTARPLIALQGRSFSFTNSDRSV